MKQALISNDDIDEGIRLRINENDREKVKEIFIERNGRSVLLKRYVK